MRKKIDVVTGVTRGYRNNNPGNIRLTFDGSGKKTYWTGEIDGSDTAFKKFKNIGYGYRAIFVILNSYITKGYNTIEKIIGRYAPSNENNTNNYIATIEKYTGKNKAAIISINDINTLQNIVTGISYQENGLEPAKENIINGYELWLKG